MTKKEADSVIGFITMLHRVEPTWDRPYRLLGDDQVERFMKLVTSLVDEEPNGKDSRKRR